MKTPDKNRLVGNISIFVAKTFSGFNQNALKFLLPKWMNAFTGVFLRLAFGTLFFWIVGWIHPDKKESVTASNRWQLLLTGAVCVAGYMFTLLFGLTYTTPISSSIFIGLQASVVYIICLVMKTETFSWSKIFGIVLGIGGVAICICTQKSSDIASNPMLGNLFCCGSTILFSIYLIVEKRFLRRLSNATVSHCSRPLRKLDSHRGRNHELHPGTGPILLVADCKHPAHHRQCLSRGTLRIPYAQNLKSKD